MDVPKSMPEEMTLLDSEQIESTSSDISLTWESSYAQLQPYVEWRDPHTLWLDSGINQKKVYRKQTRQIQMTGWFGAPLLVWQADVLSGGIRWVAARHAGLGQVPIVDLSQEGTCITLFGEATWNALSLYHGNFGSAIVTNCLREFGTYDGNLDDLELI